ncbi:MAG: DeoR/GlpR family DNA-binding transcription regulator, partial [Oscillospiraceae bacterium]|nr:DeoR/GlpR family DNA-binding transcription regulator [Oscillospiraceae bacterium]
MMGKAQRHEQLLHDNLRRSGYISNKQAEEMLGVSASTIRRLFINLEANRTAVRKHGGIQYLPTPEGTADYLFEQHEVLHESEKLAIAACAADQVESGDTLFIDWGTTTQRFCMMLAKRLEEDIHNITVFTNSQVNIHLLCERCTVFGIGGQYRSSRRDFTGYLAEESLKNLQFTKCFVGCDGYSSTLGFSQFDFPSARINEIAFANSRKRYILMDSSKYSTPAT